MFLCQTHCVFFLPSLGSTSNADQKKPPGGGFGADTPAS